VRDLGVSRLWRVDASKLVSVGLSFGVVMAALGAIAVPSASAAGGVTCTGQENPIVTTQNPFYNVENFNSSGGSACLDVSSTAEQFRVYNTRSSSGQYIGFKTIYTGCENGACLEPQYPALVSSIESEPTSWSFSSNFSQINGQFDAIYDSFFNTTAFLNNKAPTEPANPTGAELEIFMNYTSAEDSLGGQELPAPVTIEGEPYNVWIALKTVDGDSWTRIAFQRTSANLTTDVSNLDIEPFIQQAVADGAIQSDWYQQDLDAGFEIWSGGDGLQTNSFSAAPPTIASSAATGTGTSAGAGGGSTSGSTGAGGTSSGSKAATTATIKPHASFALPECSTTYSKAQCAAFRRTAGAWRYAFGFASGAVKVTKVMVTAYRYKQKGANAKTITVKARLIGSTAWKAHLGTLTKGRWRFRAVATNKAGVKVSTNTITETINVGLAATARIPSAKTK
jgi:cellulose 1,4-beta-cellobiosidase